jgi:peptide/nickel transport system substrate-binding protein
MVTRKKVPIAIGIIAVALVALMTASWVGASGKADVRHQTLITGGTQWGGVNGFNPYNGQYAAGEVGLVYETLLRYNPLTDQYIPWLATKAEFTGAKVFTINVRSGVKWSDGDSLTGADVAYTLNLGRYASAFWHNLWAATGGAVASGNTVTMTFTGTPNYQEFQNAIWNIPIVQKSQWSAGVHNSGQVTTFLADPTKVPIGTGPFTVDHSATGDGTVKVQYQKKATWWATSAVGAPSPRMKFVTDLVNSSNNVALGYVIHGDEDLNNNYLPGITQLLSSNYGLKTYYAKKPYNLAANTAWLVPNTKRAPMNNAAFRKALAWAINVNHVVTADYGNLVEKADSSGLLKIWKKYINKSLVKKYGFTYNPKKAVAILKAAKFKKKGKWFVQPNGKAIKLGLIVPQGWADWMTAIDMISADLRKVGINVKASYPANFFTLRNAGTFDLLIDNSAQMSDTPWTYYNYMYNQPIIAQQTFANFGRYTNKAAWNLTKSLNKVGVHKTAAMNKVISKIQKISLTQMSQIPLWYNGVWAQMTDQVWTNWPSSTSSRKYIPCMWRGYLQMTAIDAITHVTLK